MGLAAGRLRHRVNIEQKITTRDDNGAPITSWLTFAAGVAAEVVPLSAKEFIAAQAMQSQISARVTIRYRSGLLPTMRIIHRGQIYNIAGALPDNVSGLEYITLPVVSMGLVPVDIGSYLLLESGGRLITESGVPIALEIAA